MNKFPYVFLQTFRFLSFSRPIQISLSASWPSSHPSSSKVGVVNEKETKNDNAMATNNDYIHGWVTHKGRSAFSQRIETEWTKSRIIFSSARVLPQTSNLASGFLWFHTVLQSNITQCWSLVHLINISHLEVLRILISCGTMLCLCALQRSPVIPGAYPEFWSSGPQTGNLAKPSIFFLGILAEQLCDSGNGLWGPSLRPIRDSVAGKKHVDTQVCLALFWCRNAETNFARKNASWTMFIVSGKQKEWIALLELSRCKWGERSWEMYFLL